MNQYKELGTDRLVIRSWLPSDYTPFAHLNADPEVMQYFPATLSKAKSDDLASRIQERIAKNGWGFWAIERKDSREFIGFVGLNQPDYELPCQPCVEVGRRLCRSAWVHEYATEAANATLSFGFEVLKLSEIVAFTVLEHIRSRKAMERLGMYCAEEFDHPEVTEENSVRRHILYRLERSKFAHNHSLLAR